MKEKIKVLVLLFLFIAILIFINKLLDNQNVSLSGNTTNVSTNLNISNNEVLDDSENNEEEKNMEKVVLEVTDETFEKEVLKETKTVLIDFYADWCGPCQVLSPIVEEVAKENQDIKVVKIDIDKAENIAIEYGVMSIPTLVVIKDGKEANRSVGLISKEKVMELIK